MNNASNGESVMSSLAAAAAAVCSSASDAYYLMQPTVLTPDITGGDDHHQRRLPLFFGTNIIDAEMAASANSGFPYQPDPLPYSTYVGSVNANITPTNFAASNNAISNVSNDESGNRTVLTNETGANGINGFEMCYDTNIPLSASVAAAVSIGQTNSAFVHTPQPRKGLHEGGKQPTYNININYAGGAMPPTFCGFCQKKIEEKVFVLIDDRSWHTGCVRCTVCAQQLDALPTCFVRDGLIYCRRDYMMRFYKRCERCNNPVQPGEMMMHATHDKTFHLDCFTCTLCGHSLRVGETYFLGENGRLSCHKHCEIANIDNNSKISITPCYNSENNHVKVALTDSTKKLKDESDKMDNNKIDSKRNSITPPIQSHLATFGDDFIQPPKSCKKTVSTNNSKGNHNNKLSSIFCDNTGKHNANNNTSHSSTNFLKMENNCGVSATTSNTLCFINDNSSVDDEFAPGNIIALNNGKSKRMRTSFKHQQLRTMKTYFNLNHNPDAKDLKQLSLKTGLSKRVLQVWFQNARAKFRRAQQTMPRCGGGSSGGDSASPTPNGIAYAMELHMLSNSMELNGLSCGTSLSGRTSLSPAESASMLDGCSFADDSTSSTGGGDNSDNDASATTANKTNTVSLGNNEIIALLPPPLPQSTSINLYGENSMARIATNITAL